MNATLFKERERMLGLHWPRWLHLPHRTAASPQPPPSPAPAPKPPTTPVPTPVDAHNGNSGFDPATPLKVNLHAAEGFTTVERKKLDQAIALFEKVMNSPEFKDAVLNYSHGGKAGFVDNNGLSNQQILDVISAAKENFEPAADHEADLTLTVKDLGFFHRNVVGYTYPTTSEIMMNRRFFDSYTPAEIAGNMAHEWMHKLGFDHDFNATAQRPYSVPYAIGDLVERLASA